MAGEIFGGASNTPQVSTGNPRTVNDSVQKAPLGAIVQWKGNKYMYVKFDKGSGSVAALVGGVVHWKVLTPESSPPVFTVTSDQTDAVAGVNSIAGVLGVVVTDQFFTYIQITGIALNVLFTAAAAVALRIVGTTTDLKVKKCPVTFDATLQCYGITLTAATTTGKANVLLQGMDWE